MANRNTPGARKRAKAAAKATASNPFVTWRQRHGYSQRDAAAALQCSRAAWLGWELGRNIAPGYVRLAMQAIDAGLKLAD